MSHHDIDDPARQAAEAASATAPQSSTLAEGARPKGTKLPVEELEDLRAELKKEGEEVNTRILAEAGVIKGIVAKTATRLVEIDEEVFPQVSVTTVSGEYELRRLLEVPHSSRVSGLPFALDGLRFPSLATYITPEGSLIDLSVTRQRTTGGRVAYADHRNFEATPRHIVKLRYAIFEALDNAAYKGVWTPKNHRPKTAKG